MPKGEAHGSMAKWMVGRGTFVDWKESKETRDAVLESRVAASYHQLSDVLAAIDVGGTK